MDILQDVEMLGKKMGFITENKNFHNISLGQGQEVGWPSLYNSTDTEPTAATTQFNNTIEKIDLNYDRLGRFPPVATR